jgi:predicted phage tail protein
MSVNQLIIKGAGGGGGGSGGNNDPVSMRSRAIFNAVFLLSEGEIAGFPSGQDPRKYIYVNEVPIVNPDGTENYRGVQVQWHGGTQFQGILFHTRQGTGAPIPVNVKISKSYGPIQRTITNAQATDLGVTLFTPQLQKIESNNDIKGSFVSFKIYLSANNGPFVEKVYDSFNGRTSGGYVRDYTFDLGGLAPPYKVKVERITDDVPVSNQQEMNDLYWQTYTTFVNKNFRYPNSALLYVRLDTAYFKGQPSITVKLLGMICAIPSNYNPTTRTYTGLWDGTFTRAYTDNPAWCVLELMTNKRFGSGNYIDIINVDKWSFYRIARYCDEQVDNGFGSTEPRFVYNEYLRDSVPALDRIKSILGQIRATAFYAGGLIMVSQDRPGLVSDDIFNESNTVCEYQDGRLTKPSFSYDGVSLSEKHAKAHITWYDPNQFDKKQTAYADLFDIGFGDDFYRYGDEVKVVDLKGCSSEGEARRHGKWLLATERLESRTITFATGSQGLLRQPGSLIRVADSHRQKARVSGRIDSANASSVTLDAPVTLAAGKVYYLNTIVDKAEVSIRVTNPPGTHTTLTLSGLASPPLPNTPWLLDGEVSSEIYRLVAVSDNNDGSYGIVGVLHVPTKFVLADSPGEIGTRATPLNPTPPAPPSNLTVSHIGNNYSIGWLASTTASVVSYELEYQEVSTNRWTPIPLSAGVTDADLVLAAGSYRFRVAAVSIRGINSQWLVSA